MQTDTRFRANGIKCRRASRVEYSLFGKEKERWGGGGEELIANPLIARRKKSRRDTIPDSRLNPKYGEIMKLPVSPYQRK